jgi:hypothetical protein
MHRRLFKKVPFSCKTEKHINKFHVTVPLRINEVLHFLRSSAMLAITRTNKSETFTYISVCIHTVYVYTYIIRFVAKN